MFFSYFVCSGCKTDTKSSDKSYPAIDSGLSSLRRQVTNEDLEFLKEQYSRFFILKYSGGTYFSLISLKQLKGDTLTIYSLSKEEYYKYQYTRNDSVNKAIYYYPFGIRQYISKTTFSTGNELFKLADSLIAISNSTEQKESSEIKVSDRYKLQYWNGKKLMEMKLNYLNENYFECLFLKIPLLYEKDSSALRLMREPLDISNN